MPAINLPSISISDKDFRSKDTMNQILDTLQKYRKELNFLLMNLDEENMPVIDEKMDGLYGRMETVDGQVSEFIQTVDGFRMTVSNYEGQVSEFIQTVDGFQTTVSNYEGQVSQFVQTVDGFQTTVANYQGQVSQFTQTVDGFQSQVSNYASEVGTFNSTITQLAGQVSSKVSYTDYNGAEIVSLIEQTASSIKLSASKIELDGITRVNKTLQLGTSGESRGEIVFANNASVRAIYGDFGFDLELDAYWVSFSNNVSFSDYGHVYMGYGSTIDFSDADVYGLDSGGMDDVITSYYSNGWCYLDYDASTGVIEVRNRQGTYIGDLIPS